MLSQRLLLVFRYLHYWLHATDEHSLHAPFIFELYTKVIKADRQLPVFQEIEALRKEKLNDHQNLKFYSPGAASSVKIADERKVSSVARHSLSGARFSRFLFRLAQYWQPSSILELGTSLGINTLYLSAHNPACRITTFEGCATSVEQATSLFSRWKHKNIELISGNIDDTLGEYLLSQKAVDMVYIDANHRYGPTLRYFSQLVKHCTPNSVLIFDDIHWSAGMEKAWEKMKQHEKVTLTIDIFDAGLVFFRPLHTKQHYILSF